MSRPVGRVGAVGGGDQRRQAGLARRAGHRRAGGVDGIHAGVDGGEQRADLAAGGVVGVQVHGQVEVLAQRRDEPGRGRRAQQPGHVLDGEHVRPGVDDLLGQAQVVVERVELLARVEQVAGVAQGHLGDRGAGVEHRLDGGRICETSLSESKMRKMSSPVRAASCTNASVTLVG